ncbi:HAD family hydrolase [Chloroflexota bacterium]
MSNTRLEAAIWDMDGVIADTGIFHYEAWRRSFAKRGVAYTEADFWCYFGQRNDNIIHAALGATVTAKQITEIADEKEAIYRQIIGGNVQALPGSLELMRALFERGVAMAVASSAPPENIEFILGRLSINKYFQAVVYGYEVKAGKPAPDVFFLAAEKLGVKPAGCVVFEDAVAGVAAAKSAGMKCVALTTSHPPERLNVADRVVENLTGISVTDLEQLIV